MWFHDHDTVSFSELIIENNEALYLYREPTDTLFSYLVYQFNKGESLKNYKGNLDVLVDAASMHYRSHLQKWLIDKPAKTIVKYENFKKDFNSEFKKICEHFEEAVDYPRLEFCSNLVTPERLSSRRVERNTLSDFMLTDNYKQERWWFRDTYELAINSIVKTNELRGFFDEDL